MPPMSDEGVHRVTWDGHSPTFHCDSDETANCRNYANCECESNSEEHQAHERVPQDECLYLPWLDAGAEYPAWETPWDDDGEPISPPDGEIVVIWNGEGYDWFWKDAMVDAEWGIM